jgi:hypothetical protein
MMASADQATEASKRSDILDRVDYRLAETEAEKEAIYSLRYRAYLHEGPSSLGRIAVSPTVSMICRIHGLSGYSLMASSPVRCASA